MLPAKGPERPRREHAKNVRKGNGSTIAAVRPGYFAGVVAAPAACGLKAVW